MNAPIVDDGESLDANRSWRDLVSSSGLSLQARLVAIYFLTRATFGRCHRRGVLLEPGDAVVECSQPKVARYLGIDERDVRRAISELESVGVLVNTGKVVDRVVVRSVRPVRIGGVRPSLYLGRPRRSRVNSPANSRVNSPCDPRVNSPCDPRVNSPCDPRVNSPANSCLVHDPVSEDLSPLPICDGETGREEGIEVRSEEPTTPHAQPLPRSAAIAGSEGRRGGGGGDRAHRLNHALMMLAGELDFAWPKSGYSERLRLLQLRADPSDPRNVRTKAGDNRTHAEVALERGKLREWALRWLEDAAAQAKDGRNPLTGAAATAPTPEERARYENHLKEHAAAATSTPATIELDPSKFATDSFVDLGAMWGEMKARGAA